MTASAALLSLACLAAGAAAGWLARGHSSITLTFSLGNTPPPDNDPRPQLESAVGYVGPVDVDEAVDPVWGDDGEADSTGRTWAFTRRRAK